MKILSFGEIIWDVYPDKAVLGGAPLNFGMHAAFWGSEVCMLSAVGSDELGKNALGQIKEQGIDTSGIAVVGNAPTGACRVTLDESGVPKYKIDELSAYDLITPSDKICDGCDVIAFGTLALRHQENRDAIKKLLCDGRFTEVFTDLNIRPPFYSVESIELCLSCATVVKISDEDGRFISEILFKESLETDALAKKLCKRYKRIKLVIVTLGEKGSACYDASAETFFYEDAVKTDVVSTVGAGDSYGAAFIVNYLRTGDIALSMKRAAAVSGYVVSQIEAVPSGTGEFVKRFAD